MSPDTRPENRQVKETLAVAGIFFALAFIIYLPSIHGPFVYDDVYYILDNPQTALGSFTPKGLLAAAASRRPLTTLSFALNHLAGGYGAFGFHAVNTAIHAMTAFLFFLLAKCTIMLLGRKENAGKTAFFAALIFLCHPLATQSVSYISQRANSMCAMFFAASILLFALGRGRNNRTEARLFYAGSALCGLLSALSKENAAMLPVMIFLYEWIFLRKGDTAWLKPLALPAAWGGMLLLAALSVVVGRGKVHPGFLAAAAVIAPLALYEALAERKDAGGKTGFHGAARYAVTAALLAVLISVWISASPFATILHEYKNIAPITLWQRLLTESRVVLYYLFLYALPFPGFLSISHDVKVSTGLFSPFSTIIAIGAIACALAFAYKIRREKPLIAFAVFMYFGNLAVESTVYPLDLLFEHRAYLPMMFLAVPPVDWALGRFPRRSAPALAVLAAVLALFTFERNMVWADDLALWQDATEKAPNSAVARNNLGMALVRQGRIPEAVASLTAAMQRDPKLMDAPYNLGLIYREKLRFKQAEEMFRRTLAIRDDFVFAHNDLGLTLMDQGREREAELHFKKALAWNPYFVKAMNNLGTLYLNRGDRSDAARQFRNALSVAPGFVRARLNLGIVLLQQGKTEEAVKALSVAVRDAPDDPEAAAQLGNAILHAGDAAKGIKLLRKSLALKPRDGDVRNSLAVALTAQGRNPEAIVEYRIALDLLEKEAGSLTAKAQAGGYSKAFFVTERAAVHKNLALTLFRMKQYEESVQQLEAAIALVPGDMDARLGLGSVLAAQGRDPEALLVFKKAAGDFPENPKALVDMGRVLVHMDRPQEALSAFSKAAILAPDDTAIHRDIGIARDLIEKTSKKARQVENN